MGYLKEEVERKRKRLEEGDYTGPPPPAFLHTSAWLQYHHMYGQNSINNGPMDPSVGRKERREGDAMRSWYQTQMDDLTHIRNKHGGMMGEGLKSFRVGDKIECQSDAVFAEATIPALVKGVVTEIADNGVHTIDCNKWGMYRLSHKSISEHFITLRGDTFRDLIHENIGVEPGSVLEAGDRVRDLSGIQAIVQRRDVHGHMIEIMDQYGQVRMIDAPSLELVHPHAPFPLVEGLQSLPLNPGQRVAVMGIDPALNQLRTNGTPANEAQGMIGQTGIVAFAFYPVPGTTMFRVLFDRGAGRDFSASELSPAEG
jgi:hypothetical protein